MKNPTTLFFFYLFIALLSACTPAQNNSDAGAGGTEIAFVGVHVLPMTENTVLQDQTVIVRDGKIRQIGPAASLKPGKRATIIEAQGKYLMPGISEMHAHIPTPREGDDSLVRETLFLYLSNGITVIRGMLGAPYHLELKKMVATDSVLSPRIYTSSPSLNGNTVKTPEEAREKVSQYQKDGYDFLKIHPGIQLDVFEELVRTAREVGIPFSGHVPIPVGIRRAIDFRYASIDHLDGYVEGLVPASAGIDPNAGGTFGYDFTPRCDPALIPELVKQTVAAGVWIVPTQSLLVRWFSPKIGAEMANEPEMIYMAPGTRVQWRQSKDQRLAGKNYSAEQAAAFIALRQQLLKEMETQGVGLLLGSDAPQVFNVPGFSIQHEIQTMVDAGLSNFTILQSGTINPARFFGEEGAYGSVQEGASADLILLAANPLEDLRNMQNPLGVMVRGKWLDRKFLDEKLAEIAEKNK